MVGVLVPEAAARPVGLRRIVLDRLTPLLFVAGPLLLSAAWIWGPALATVLLSFTSFDGVAPPAFAGLRNYRGLLADPNFHRAGIDTLIWLVAFLTVPLAGGLGLAVALDRRLRFSRLYQSAIYLPMVLALPVIGLVFQWFLLPGGTGLSAALKSLGLASGWLADPDLALVTVLIPAVWRQVGCVMVLYLAGLKGIDPGMREAAFIDGAGEWRLFRRITLPLLAPVTSIVAGLSAIESLRAFDLVWVMRGASPGSADLLATYLYRQVIGEHHAGYGTAAAVVLLGASTPFILRYLVHQLRREGEP